MADAPVAGADRLAFVEESVTGQDVYVIDVSRSTATRVTHGLTDVEGPVWSPDGTRLAFAAKSGGTNERMVRGFALSPDGISVAYSWNREIIVTDLETGARRQLVQDAWGPAWSRDGRRIAFLVSASQDVSARLFHIETIEPDGRNRRRVSQWSGNYWALTWAPTPALHP